MAKLAVLGNPVEHSRSPDIHRQFGEAAGIELSYEKILVAAGDFDMVVRRFMNDGTGLNVTVPCKRDAWALVDEMSDKAALAEAVNTISRSDDGGLFGSNTDGEGMLRDIVGNLGWKIAGKRVLVIGSGGAVSGVLGDLLEAAPESVDLFNRTQDKAERLAHRFADQRLQAVAASALESQYDIVINGTSAGLAGEDIELPGRIVGSESRCYDMIYGAGTTRFNQWCQAEAACQVSDGLGMLVEQAALAFEIWLGAQVETSPVIESLRSTIT
ncbi:MAG: shikimate dehydrogenase [Gammaproteobacteria bacterium]|nr:shikimate dehydrogenase [Gammaproteobacteria bacterium]MBT7371759.1 shikimate dehydrogenase [Gammaproteobacteria bacterium]